VAETNEHLNTYAQTGLRTLLIAQKEMSEKEYADWNDKYNEA
jgi:phospholipid-translocating ATPase